MVTRKQAQQKALDIYMNQMQHFGGNSIALIITKNGRQNHWTFNEIIHAIKTDSKLKFGPNPIDDIFENMKLNEKKELLKSKYSNKI